MRCRARTAAASGRVRRARAESVPPRHVLSLRRSCLPLSPLLVSTRKRMAEMTESESRPARRHRAEHPCLLPPLPLRNRALGVPGGLVPVAGRGLADQRFGQLASPGDIELAVRPAEVRLSGLRLDEQLLCYLTVGPARRGQPGHAQLAGGQGVAAGDRVAPWLGARRHEFGPGLARDAAGAPVMRQVESPLQLSPRRCPLAGPAQSRTMVGERPGQLDWRRGVLEYPDRLAEQGEAAVAARDQARGAQRDTQ